MPITHFCQIFNILDELATVLETLINYLQRFYLRFKGREVRKLWSYSHLPALKTVPVPVTEPGTGDRAWFRISLVVPVPVPVRNSVPVGS